jgi:hypothetical protein
MDHLEPTALAQGVYKNPSSGSPGWRPAAALLTSSLVGQYSITRKIFSSWMHTLPHAPRQPPLSRGAETTRLRGLSADSETPHQASIGLHAAWTFKAGCSPPARMCPTRTPAHSPKEGQDGGMAQAVQEPRLTLHFLHGPRHHLPKPRASRSPPVRTSRAGLQA